jgi:hypothetical protein
MSDGVIERGIPISPAQRESIEKLYPEILLLEVGDSFVASKPRLSFHISVALFGINHGQRHEVRKLDGDDYRVWRTA